MIRMNPLLELYYKLNRAFGPQNWWPGDTAFEIAVGAILTQNTSWSNVEKAIQNLKRHRVLSSKALHEMPVGKLADLVRPAGYFNIKAQRLKSFIGFLINAYGGSMKKMKKEEMHTIREKLMGIKGIGPETADSILLYALEKPSFVIDAYTKRVLSRHGILEDGRNYNEFQELFHGSLKRDVPLYNEYHALFVKLGKTYCRKHNEKCAECPLNTFIP
jgi:endonuclease III related protein